MTLDELKQHYDVVATIDLGAWTDDYEKSVTYLRREIRNIYKPAYNDNQRIVFTHTKDYYIENSEPVGIVLRNLQTALNELDISNFFAIVLSTNPNVEQEVNFINSQSSDPVPVQYYQIKGEFTSTTLEKHPYSKTEEYQYGSSNPIKIKLSDISERERFLLSESKTFCIYPWVHIHAIPTGEVYPCCHAVGLAPVGNCKTNTLKEIYHGPAMEALRQDMLSETPNSRCTRCYEQEESGFFSGRRSANKHHGHHISKIETNPFEMTYWDIRFSNLCNLRCRSCGHIFSSQWYQDQTKLAGPEWKKNNPVLIYAGKTETDMWEQLIPHLDYVEQIYFAGGEPLLMEEHYNILEELVKRKRFDVRLIYNTNFTHTQLKGKSVFEYWQKFDSVAVGASLDDSGARGEYIRKGTDWKVVEENRREMLRQCPGVDFYISPTLSIMNAWHIVDFHRDWVEKGFINPQDLNVNILQNPAHYRIDIAPPEYKAAITEKIQQHIDWLRPQDHLQRATVGFESAINFMNAKDNSALLQTFWEKTAQLDAIRKENILDAIPELKALK